MKHLDLIQLTDYIREATAEAQAAAMEAHLASGCQKCRLTADLLHKLAAAARSDSQVQVPDYALRCARAIFLLQQPEKVQILPRIPARLLYDSFREPLPAGLRTQQRLSRQTLYQAGDYSLDLRLENERGSSRVALVGQIENRNHPEKRVSNVPVLLVSGKQILAQVVSNSLGEFQMEYMPSKHLRLYVPVPQADKRNEGPINHFARERQQGESATAKNTRRQASGRRGNAARRIALESEQGNG